MRIIWHGARNYPRQSKAVEAYPRLDHLAESETEQPMPIKSTVRRQFVLLTFVFACLILVVIVLGHWGL